MEQVSKVSALLGFLLILADIESCSSFSARTFSTDLVIGANSAAVIVESWGVATEVYEVVSEDGYFTQLLRIPNNGSYCKQPTILHHGLLCSSADWLLQDPENALPYQLWKEGFDVWIPSARGTKSSQKHENLDTNNVEYWKFSMDEIGHYDVPATIDFVLEKTGAAKVNWVGHSMGCAVLHIALHYKPEYNNKISRFVAMAPGVYTGRSTAVVTHIMSLIADSVHENLADLLYKGRAMSTSLLQIIRPFLSLVCSSAINPMANLLCGNFLFLFTGHLSLYVPISAKVLERVWTWTPAETSIRAVTHYTASFRCGTFAYKPDESTTSSIITGKLPQPQDLPVMYPTLFNQYANVHFRRSFGLNLQFSLNPIVSPVNPIFPFSTNCDTTKYLLNRTEVPMLLLYGNRDGLIDPKDAEQTLLETGSFAAGIAESILLPDYQHMDFLYAETSKKLAYEPAIQFLSRDCPVYSTFRRSFSYRKNNKVG